MKKHLTILIAVLVIASQLLVACAPAPTPTATLVPPTMPPAPTATPVPPPTATPAPPTATSGAVPTATAAEKPVQLSPTAVASAAIAPYAVVDTGQATCYDNSNAITCPAAGAAFYGQDAQYQGNQPSYTLSSDGLTVYDNVTGLTWMQSPDTNMDGSITYDDKLTYANAVTFPATLNAAAYGGYTDWRLPTVKELYSLINHSGVDLNPNASTGTTPFIDTEVFGFAYGFVGESAGSGPGETTMTERIIDSQWATSTLYDANTDQMFGVNFADGRIKGYPVGAGTDKPYHVLCVRGNTSYGVNDFVDNGDGTITDNATGLMWSQADSGEGLNWEQALAWVQEKNAENYLGYSDWRLPNAKELQSIVDYSRSPDTTASAVIDPLFTCTQITNPNGQADYGFYWTSTTHVGESPEGELDGNDANYVAFGRAMGYMNGRWVDVHGAGCQRSDPKSGDPDDYSEGRGPQGDQVNIFNYVRLVRGGAATTATGQPPSQPSGSSAVTGQPGDANAYPAPGQPSAGGPGGQPSTGTGGQPGGQPPTGSQPGSQPPTGGPPAEGERPDASGRVTAVDGNTIQVENPHDGAFTIVTDASTGFRVDQDPGSLADVTVDRFVAASGQVQADGTLLASLVIVSDTPPALPGSQTGPGSSPGAG